MNKTAIFFFWALATFSTCANAQSPCERFPAGSTIRQPEDLFSKHGVLSVDFTYQTTEDANGKTLYCFVNSDGAQSPTLHVRPGDTLILLLTNLVPPQAGMISGMPEMQMSKAGAGGCGAMNMTPSSVNLHYHGTNTPPVCHQDEVIHTIINPGETFRYEVHFPRDEPPGLYWYHPHIHGISEAAVQGGASGALVVEGIEKVNPAVVGMPQQFLLIRDTPLQQPDGVNSKVAVSDPPANDLSVNYIPVAWPAYVPAEISMPAGSRQFWRVVNSAADTILDLQLLYDGQAQPLGLVALDGVPIGSQDGGGRGNTLTRTHVLLPPAGRAEFIVTGPASDVADARFVTAKVDTGPDGDSDPARPLLAIRSLTPTPTTSIHQATRAAQGSLAAPPPERFADLAKQKPVATRKLYFSEDDTNFFITVEGQVVKPFEMEDPPAIVTNQGAVEDWTIENRTGENHEFHIHQIHFKLMARDGVALAADDQQFLDTVDVPFWTGQGPYPSVTLRMDFRGPDIGDFVYHCHILEHEDGGMMAIIRVLKAKKKK